MDIQESDQLAIRSVISQQIEAFRADDGAAAFAIATPAIQRQFGTVEQFMHMVKTAYHPVYRPRSVVFESLTWLQGDLAQPVVLLGDTGNLYRAYYLMEWLQGNWRIAGCYLVAIEG